MSYSWGAARNLRPIERVRPTSLAAELGGEVDPVQMRRLVAELAPMVGVWERLIDQHAPNRAGRCRQCAKGASGAPAAPWPCSVYGIAEMARRRHHRDHG